MPALKLLFVLVMLPPFLPQEMCNPNFFSMAPCSVKIVAQMMLDVFYGGSGLIKVKETRRKACLRGVYMYLSFG